MSFLYPLGLLFLLGVPIVIIIYLLKNRYVEKVIPSIYIWNLSEKFLKKKKPFKKITDLLSLILQILIIVIVAISISNPVLTIKDGADNICFVLDASGSMNIETNGVKRFDLAKSKIKEIVSTSSLGSSYTLIVSKDKAEREIEKEKDRNKFFEVLDKVEVSFETDLLTDSLSYVQSYYQEESISQAYLITDKNYSEVENIKIINVSNHEENYALYNTKYSKKNDKISVSSNLIAYETSEEVEVIFFVDEEMKESKKISLKQMEEQIITFETENINFASIRLEIAKKDALSFDNYQVIYNENQNKVSNILLVSEKPFYLKSILEALHHNVEVVSPTSYVEKENTDIYIFDAFSPNKLPENASTWLVNTPSNIDASGFVVQEEVALSSGAQMAYANDKSSLYQKLTEDTKKNKVAIKQYQKYGLYRSFTPILTCNRVPMIFAGTNDYGNREIVFSFDFANSDFPLLYDYIVLMRNFVNWSNPHVIDETFYKTGDILSINLINGIKDVRVVSPSNKVDFIDFNENNFILKEVGVYQIQVNYKNEVQNFEVFVSFDNQESKVTINEESILLKSNGNKAYNDMIYDDIIILLIVLFVLLILDWGVYTYEQR